MTQGQFLSRELLVWIQCFPYQRQTNLICPIYLPLAGRRRDEFISFPTVFMARFREQKSRKEGFTLTAGMFGAVLSGSDGIMLLLFLQHLLSLWVTLREFLKRETTWLVMRRHGSPPLSRVRPFGDSRCDRHEERFSISPCIAYMVSLCRDILWRVHWVVWSWAGDDFSPWGVARTCSMASILAIFTCWRISILYLFVCLFVCLVGWFSFMAYRPLVGHLMPNPFFYIY